MIVANTVRVDKYYDRVDISLTFAGEHLDLPLYSTRMRLFLHEELLGQSVFNLKKLSRYSLARLAVPKEQMWKLQPTSHNRIFTSEALSPNCGP